MLVYEAFGWEKPEFVHLPVILDPSGKGKMSKRKPLVDGREMPVFVSDFIQEGYLPEAVFNFLANTGGALTPSARSSRATRLLHASM